MYVLFIFIIVFILQHLKDQYLAYRRIVHNDSVDVFTTQKENKLKSKYHNTVQGCYILEKCWKF